MNHGAGYAPESNDVAPLRRPGGSREPRAGGSDHTRDFVRTCLVRVYSSSAAVESSLP